MYYGQGTKALLLEQQEGRCEECGAGDHGGGARSDAHRLLRIGTWRRYGLQNYGLDEVLAHITVEVNASEVDRDFLFSLGFDIRKAGEEVTSSHFLDIAVVVDCLEVACLGQHGSHRDVVVVEAVLLQRKTAAVVTNQVGQVGLLVG